MNAHTMVKGLIHIDTTMGTYYHPHFTQNVILNVANACDEYRDIQTYKYNPTYKTPFISYKYGVIY